MGIPGLLSGGTCRRLRCGQRANFPMAAGVRGEEADEIAIGVTQQQRPVTPGQRSGLGDEVPDEPGQVLMHAVHVIDEELDDHAVVAGRAGGAGCEQRDGTGAADREGGAGWPGSRRSPRWTRSPALPWLSHRSRQAGRCHVLSALAQAPYRHHTIPQIQGIPGQIRARLPPASPPSRTPHPQKPQTRRHQPSGHARGTDHRNMRCHSLEPDSASEHT